MDVMTFNSFFMSFFKIVVFQRFGIHFNSKRTFNAFYDSNLKFYCITFGIELINVFGDKAPFAIGAASIKL